MWEGVRGPKRKGGRGGGAGVEGWQERKGSQGGGSLLDGWKGRVCVGKEEELMMGTCRLFCVQRNKFPFQL